MLFSKGSRRAKMASALDEGALLGSLDSTAGNSPAVGLSKEATIHQGGGKPFDTTNHGFATQRAGADEKRPLFAANTLLGASM